jgi:DNA helicase-2/ATP-dependent DNA helicase PcrA
LLTFTNKASKEMLARVGNVLPHDISRLWGGTFHHVGHRILRRHAEEMGLQRSFSILDREDAKDLISACIPDAGIDVKDKRFPKADVLVEIFSLAVNTEKSVEQIIGAQYEYFEDVTESIVKASKLYSERKRQANGVDYDDLLSLPLRLLQEHDSIRQYYQHRFLHILVDEYQDTNKIQADFIDLLAADHHQVMVVGDDAQSIYSWRGANFANIMNFPDRHPGARIIRIETNYRSIPEILNLANASISNNTNQFPKELHSSRESGAKPAVIALDDSRQQAMFIAQRALELRDEGVELSQIAVLYRSHFHCMELQMELTRRNIPFQITSGLRFFEQAHIKDVAAYLKVAINPFDEVSFRRIAQSLPGVGGKTAQRLWNERSQGKEWESIKVPDKAAKVWKQWAETFRQLQAGGETMPPARQIDLVLEAVYKDYLKTAYPNYQNRLEDLNQLMNFAAGFSNTSEFLAQLSLMTNMDAEVESAGAVSRDDEAIKLSTIHQAKGLEWKAVFVIMLCDGLFPSSRSTESTEGEEEERRLFYVAVTRARDELYLTYPRIRMTSNQTDMWQQPSRFLNEFGKDLANVWKIKTESAW